MMEVDVLGLDGKPVGKINLPKVFSEPVRKDLIMRAFLSTKSRLRLPYGTDKLAGQRTSAHYHGYRRHRYTMMNREIARLPRLHGKTVPFLTWRARFVPQAKGGREAHPPKVEKIWEEKINKKERQKAINSAIAATAVKDIVLNRGHRVDLQLPIVVDDGIQQISKTKEMVNFLNSIGLTKEIERVKKRKIRAGKGKTRGRRYKKKVGPLIIVTEDKGIRKAIKNIPGFNVCRVENLCAAYLAPGGVPGRLTIWTKSAIDKLEKMS